MITHNLDELKKLPQWVNYVLYPKPDGSYSKPPINPRTLWNGSSTDATAWTDYGTAAANIGKTASYKPKDQEPIKSEVKGVGFIMTGGYCGIDLDHVIDDEGKAAPFVERLLKVLDTYAEISVSGHGIHLLLYDPGLSQDIGGKFKVNADATPDKAGKYDIEIYAYKNGGGRYLTVTGNPYEGYDRPINRTKGAKLREIYDYYTKDRAKKATVPSPSVGSLPQEEDDRALLEKAFRGRNGSRIQALYNGDLSAYNGDHSHADQAFINDLCYWTNGNAEQIDRIFRSSGLMRNKWDEKHYSTGETYGERTIAEALKGFIPWTPGSGFTEEQKREYGRRLHTEEERREYGRKQHANDFDENDFEEGLKKWLAERKAK